MSLLPLSTAWMAVSRLAPQPVAFYAAVFFLVNATYICLTWELIHRSPGIEVPSAVRRIMHFRSVTTLCLFGVAALVALKYPLDSEFVSVASFFISGQIRRECGCGDLSDKSADGEIGKKLRQGLIR